MADLIAGEESLAQVNPPSPLDIASFNVSLERRAGLTIHIVPFSHVSDVLLAEQAQRGPEVELGPQGRSNATVLGGSVDDIFSSTVAELSDTSFHPNRSFSFADLKFFKQWYEKQDGDMQATVKNLVA